MGFAYIGIGAILLLWAGNHLRRGLKPFRLRPFLLLTLGAVMIYNGLRLEHYIP